MYLSARSLSKVAFLVLGMVCTARGAPTRGSPGTNSSTIVNTAAATPDASLGRQKDITPGGSDAFGIPAIPIPRIGLPAIQIPRVAFPRVGIPGVAIPGVSLPGFSLPGFSLPGFTI